MNKQPNDQENSKEGKHRFYGGSIGVSPVNGYDEYFTLGDEDQNDIY
jgi:hypothetical protein